MNYFYLLFLIPLIGIVWSANLYIMEEVVILHTLYLSEIPLSSWQIQELIVKNYGFKSFTLESIESNLYKLEKLGEVGIESSYAFQITDMGKQKIEESLKNN